MLPMRSFARIVPATWPAAPTMRMTMVPHPTRAINNVRGSKNGGLCDAALARSKSLPAIKVSAVTISSGRIAVSHAPVVVIMAPRPSTATAMFEPPRLVGSMAKRPK
ncbi:hypothetical protein WR25_05829 [Diploscapter pachys]|uniref:Uncharacterized protein n=1 Tax=Diploscapter pachys TaxID=2018661 RepID=A0A2A2K0Q1_9BILA|nr:hypothetical protein WR25_05829 [Diploscapter pachys]